MRCIPLFAAGICLVATCRDGSSIAGCSESLAFVSVQAVDTLGLPATGVAVSHYLPRSGRVLVVPQDTDLVVQGRYVVLTDIQRGQILPAGDTVRMTGIQGATSFVADFLLDVPDGCHIRKLGGPDTVALETTSQRLRR